MKAEVQHAFDEVASSCPHSSIVIAEDLNGGACVLLEGLQLGAPYAQAETWVGFHITDACPYADVYPHFVRADLARLDGALLGPGMSPNQQWPNPSTLRSPNTLPARPAVQVSRKSNKRDASGLETPAIKLLKVLRWMQSR